MEMENAKKFRRIGVLTSGGDAPGMNAAVRAVTRAALAKGVEVIGVYEGYKGLVYPNLRLLYERDVSNIIDKGGTILYSDRCLEFATEEGIAKAKATCEANKIDGIVAIGGDGTFRGATDFTNHGVPCIGIPGTIDNDITSTDYSIGFDTAMNTVVQMVDRLRDTCDSHARCNVVEVMGRAAGYIALEAGIATGATAIAVKEVNFDKEEMLKKILRCRENGKRNFIIMVAEGIPLDFPNNKTFSEDLAKWIQEETKKYQEENGKPDGVNYFMETKFARLAHVVRGGSPTLRDRLLATQMGYEAVDLLLKGVSDRVVCIQDDAIVSEDINFALTLDMKYKCLYDPTYEETLKTKKPEKYNAFIARYNSYSDAEREKMLAFCEKKFKAFKKNYDIAGIVSN